MSSSNYIEQEIIIKLPTGNPKGMKVAEISTEVLSIIEVPRSCADKFVEIFSGIGNAIVLLLCEKNKQLFITSDKSAITKSDFLFEWDTSVVVSFSNNKMPSKISHYLQFKICELIAKIGRVAIENENNIYEPDASISTMQTCQRMLPVLNTLLCVLKYYFIDESEEPIDSIEPKLKLNQLEDSVTTKPRINKNIFDELVFICQKPEINAYALAKYNPDNKETTVLKHSKFVSGDLKKSSLSDGYKKTRLKLIKKGLLVPNGDHLELIEDYTFSSPSCASGIVLGHTTNGKDYWKTEDGKKLGYYLDHFSNKDTLVDESGKQGDSQDKEPPVFVCENKRKEVYAEGIFDNTNASITVRKGSSFALNMIDSLIGSRSEKERQKMIREGVLVLDGECYLLEEDYTFKTVSRASKVVNGSGGGRKAWVNKEGLNITDYYYSNKS